MTKPFPFYTGVKEMTPERVLQKLKNFLNLVSVERRLSREDFRHYLQLKDAEERAAFWGGKAKQ